MEKIFNTQDKCADFVRHFSLHMLYFFHILPVISSLADILLLLSFSDDIKFFHFTEWPKDAYNSIFWFFVCDPMATGYWEDFWDLYIRSFSQICWKTTIIFHISVFFSQNYHFQKSLVFLLCNDACWKTEDLKKRPCEAIKK